MGDPSGDHRLAVEALRKCEAKLKKVRAEKNDLVLKAYPAMDALDRIIGWLHAQPFQNSPITAARLHELLEGRTA